MSNSNVFGKGWLPNGIFTFSGFQTSRIQKSRCKAPISSTSKTPKRSPKIESTYLTKTHHLSTQMISISGMESCHLSLFLAFRNLTSLRLLFPYHFKILNSEILRLIIIFTIRELKWPHILPYTLDLRTLNPQKGLTSHNRSQSMVHIDS
jgi:hypothetical protein